MSLTNRIRKLESDHKDLDLRVNTLESSGHFDDDELRDLKKRKLRIKDELEILRRTNSSVRKMRKI